MIAGEAMGMDRAGLLARPEAEFPATKGEALLAGRLAGKPLAYVLGRREFWGREFTVGPGVLVPRQDTETLVEAVLGLDLPSDARVLEVGVGSGCVAATLALERPLWRVAGTELSPVALGYARENAERLGGRVELREGDLLAPFAGERFDLVVSNPPYISPEEEIAREVRVFEPEQALFAEEGGLAFYRRLAEEAHAFAPRLLVEVGWKQAGAVGTLLAARGWRDGRTHLDLSGIERVVGAVR